MEIYYGIRLASYKKDFERLHVLLQLDSSFPFFMTFQRIARHSTVERDSTVQCISYCTAQNQEMPGL